MWEVTLTPTRSHRSSMRGMPSLKPYSYHFCTGKSGYFGSIGGKGLPAPRSGCAPVSNCMESEMTSRALLGQKSAVDVGRGCFACARVVEIELLASPTAAAVLVVINVRRSILV